jgi:hypothetical protein
MLLIVGTLEAVTALASFLNPSVHAYFLNLLIDYGYGLKLMGLGTFRIYGFASNLTFTMPIIQAFLAVVSIYMYFKYKWIYILLTPLLFLSAVINARTSIVVFAIGIIVLLFNIELKIKYIIRIIIITTCSIVFLFYGVQIIHKNSETTYDWIEDGFDEIYSFIQGDVSNGYYFGYLSDKKRYDLPDDLAILFGKGTRAYSGNKYNLASDVGYINDIWLGGIFYTLAIYFIFIKMLLDIYNYRRDNVDLAKFLFYFLIFTLFVVNIKGIIFSENDLTTFVFILYVFVNRRCINNLNCKYNSVRK